MATGTEFRIVPEAVEATRLAKELVSRLRWARRFFAQVLKKISPVVERHERSVAAREKLRVATEADTPWTRFQLEGYVATAREIRRWYIAAEQARDDLMKRIDAIDAVLKTVGDAAQDAAEGYLAGRQTPPAIPGVEECFWELRIVRSVAAHFVAHLSDSLEAAVPVLKAAEYEDETNRLCLDSSAREAVHRGKIVTRKLIPPKSLGRLFVEVDRDYLMLKNAARTAMADSDSRHSRHPADLSPKPRAVAEPRIVAVAVEVTEAVLFLIQDLHSIREQCEKDVVTYTKLAKELRENESFREKYLDEELRPRDPDHVNGRQLYLSGFGFVRPNLDNWYSGMPPCAASLCSQLARIDGELKRLGDSGCDSIEARLSHLQRPQRWRGYLPRAWDVSVAIDVARRVAKTLGESFQALPEGWYTGSETAPHWRQMIRSAVWKAAHAAEIVGRMIGSEAEWRTLEGEVARDLAHLRDPAGAILPGGATLFRTSGGEPSPHRDFSAETPALEEAVPRDVSLEPRLSGPASAGKRRKRSRYHAEAKYPIPDHVTANVWIQECLQKYPETKEWSSDEWQSGIGVAKSTISETPIWKSLRAVRGGMVFDAERRSRRPNRKAL